MRGPGRGRSYVGSVPDTLCRLTIHVTGQDGPTAADLALPAGCPVGVLIPSIVDVVLGGSATADDPQRWQLTHVGGGRLDTSMTLRENGVHDGELIVLASAAPPVPVRAPGDPSAAIAGVAGRAPSAKLTPAVPTAAALAVTMVSAAALAWSGSTGAIAAPLWTAAGLSAATAAGAVVIGRTVRQLTVVLSISAVVNAAVAGFLAVPNAPWPSACLLAASCGFTISILLLRMASGGTSVLTALAAITGTVAAACAFGVITSPRLEAAGAVLTVLSLAALSAASKLTVAAAGLGPSRAAIGDRRAAVAHRMLTGLVAGWSSTAMLGVVVVALHADIAVHAAASPAVAALFAADVGLLLLLRQRTHVDAWRRIMLGTAGFSALVAAFTVVVSAAPQHAWWCCALAVIAAVIALRRSEGEESSNPVVRHGVQSLEYVALAAVVPLAFWVMDVYGLVRDLSLP